MSDESELELYGMLKAICETVDVLLEETLHFRPPSSQTLNQRLRSEEIERRLEDYRALRRYMTRNDDN